MTSLAIVDAVALAKVKFYLAGLRGYSGKDESIAHLARTIQDACVSVAHAEAVLRSFDDECPTPREIKEVAFNLREQYLPPQPSQEEQWRKEYGPPDKNWSESMLNTAKIAATSQSARKAQFAAQLHQLRTQSIKDALNYENEVIEITGAKERAASRTFWASHLRWLEENYPEQVAAVRAGREPVFPEDRILKPAKAASINTESFDEPRLKPVTAESFEGVKPVTQKRCATCGGSGRLAGDDYCNDCEIGRDLRRQEARYGGEA